MALWRSHFHMRVLLSWVVLAFIVTTLLAVAALFLVFDQFAMANVCFIITSFFIFAKVAELAISSHDPWYSRMIFTFLLFGLVGVGIVETVKGVNAYRDKKERAASPKKENASPATNNKVATDSKPAPEVAPQPTQQVHNTGVPHPSHSPSKEEQQFLAQLTQLYKNSHDGISPEMLSGLELPPENWLNDQLQKYKKAWRIQNGQIVEIAQHEYHHGTREQGNNQLLPRLSGLLSEGSDLMRQCRTIQNSYQTPVETRADLANGIVNWSKRVEAVLSMDTDTYLVTKWKNTVVYSTPHAPTIADYCTDLNLKLDRLQRIIKRKNITPRQAAAMLRSLIEQGESLKSFCVAAENEKEIMEQEANWVDQVNTWLEDFMDESYQNQFNRAGSTGARPLSKPKLDSSLAVWQRNDARVKILRGFVSEIEAR